jgi:hypothetical protein
MSSRPLGSGRVFIMISDPAVPPLGIEHRIGVQRDWLSGVIPVSATVALRVPAEEILALWRCK